MANVRVLQTSFVAGEFDPTLEGRTDIGDYRNGASKLRNVYIRPQGGAFRREGLQYFGQTNGNDASRLIPFQFNDAQTYLLVLKAGRIDVYRTDVPDTIQASLTSSPISNITSAMVSEINWTQSADTLILAHKDLKPISVTRSSHTSWSASEISFTNIPPYSYDGLSTSNPSGAIFSDVTTGKAKIVSEGTPFDSSYEGQFINTEKGGRIFVTNYVSTSELEGTVVIELEDTTIVAKTSKLSTTGTTVGSSETFTTNTASFTEASVGQFIVNPAGGVAVITAYTSTINVTATIREEFASDSNIEGWYLDSGYNNWEFEEGYEDVMSSTRGWPRSVTFHKSRLVFGGLRDRPQTLLFSKIGDFFNFDIGEGLDDEAIDVTIDDDQVNIIKNIFSGRALNIFTSGGEFSIRSSVDSTLTPANISSQIAKETRHGSSKTRPASVDGAVVFVERDDPTDDASGNVLRQFLYNDTEQSFVAPNISVFSQHLFSNPVSMDIRRATSSQPSNYLYVVNDNGTCAVLNSLREQNLLAWSLFETEGDFEDVAVSGNKAFFIVKRTINSSTVRYIEVLNEEHFMDSSIRTDNGSATTSWSGLDHLDGETVKVRGDDFILDDADVSSGSITSSESVTILEAGLNFSSKVTSLPIDVVIQGESFAGQYKTPVFANVRLYDSRNFTVNYKSESSSPAFRRFDLDTLDSPISTFTGWKKVYIGGYNRDVRVEVTQEEPLEFNILAVQFGVKV
jgi:hypothetical protein